MSIAFSNESSKDSEPATSRGRPRKLWAGIEVDWFRNPQVRRLSSDAKLLFIAARLYSSEHMTDGIIERDAVDMIAVEAKVSLTTPLATLVKALLTSGVWKEEGDTYNDVDFARANQSAEKRLHRWQQERGYKQASKLKEPNIRTDFRASLSTTESEIESESESKGKEQAEGPALSSNGSNGHKATNGSHKDLLPEPLATRWSQQGER